MKLTLTKLSLALFAALTLSACSGGGGGGGDSHQPAPVNPTENKQPETLPKQSQDVPAAPKNEESQKVDEVKPSEGKTPPVDDAKPKAEDKKPSVEYPSFNNAYDEKSGVVFQLDNQTGSPIPQMIDKFTEKDINLLEVNGQMIELVPSDQHVGEFSSKNENGVIQLIGSSENTRWGAIYSPNAKYDYVFAVGRHATKVENMPMDSQVSYAGKAVHLEGNDSPIARDATFTVNFGEKVLEGQISADNAQPIKLHANIGGNGFEGMTEQGTSTKGGFYGENASELIGTYESHDPNNWYMGAYGASKK